MAGVFAGMFVPGTVTTTGVTTNHAHAQVYPAIALFQAIFAAIGARFHIVDQVPVLAAILRQLIPAPQFA
jgi:hypothetical protein